jgi:hypothetical protein
MRGAIFRLKAEATRDRFTDSEARAYQDADQHG